MNTVSITGRCYMYKAEIPLKTKPVPVRYSFLEQRRCCRFPNSKSRGSDETPRQPLYLPVMVVICDRRSAILSLFCKSNKKKTTLRHSYVSLCWIHKQYVLETLPMFYVAITSRLFSTKLMKKHDYNTHQNKKISQ